MKRIILTVVLFATVLAVAWGVTKVQVVAKQIVAQSRVDEATAADIIIVLGAAEYSGRPSPVLEARLNHALYLYQKGLAPRILTTGGSGGDPTYTEGGVAHNYLARRGVPSEAILVESEGESTVHSMVAAAEIMQRFGMKSCIVVSDGYHIFRVKKLLERRGVQTYGSPRPEEARPDTETLGGYWVFVRQAIAYGLWRVGIAV
jgi:uncharacterized SAM-binding protein YcdF (DUF218 family)